MTHHTPNEGKTVLCVGRIVKGKLTMQSLPQHGTMVVHTETTTKGK